MRVVWTEPAETDLDELFNYIARDAPIYAELPRVGRKVAEADSNQIRELIVQSQRVTYAIDDDQEPINILALVHVRRNLASKDGPPWR